MSTGEYNSSHKGAEIDSVITKVTATSGSWDDIITTVNTNSSSWVGLPTITEIISSTYTLLSTDDILHVTHTSASAVTITWPTSLITDSNELVVKDASFSASVNNIMIATEGSELIDNSSSVTMSIDGDSYSFYCYNSNIFIK